MLRWNDKNKAMNTRKIGAQYEQMAAEYLEALGYQILRRNYRCMAGELDLIAMDRETLVFVEVKYRAKAGEEAALGAVGKIKQKALTKTAVFYLTKECGSLDLPCRFDVVSICGKRICHIKNAFETECFY